MFHLLVKNSAPEPHGTGAFFVLGGFPCEISKFNLTGKRLARQIELCRSIMTLA